MPNEVDVVGGMIRTKSSSQAAKGNQFAVNAILGLCLGCVEPAGNWEAEHPSMHATLFGICIRTVQHMTLDPRRSSQLHQRSKPADSHKYECTGSIDTTSHYIPLI